MQNVVGCVTRFQSGRLTRPRPRTISSCPMPCRQLRLRTDQHPHSIQRCRPGRRRERDHSWKPEVKHHASGIRRIQDVGGGDISGQRYGGRRSSSQSRQRATIRRCNHARVGCPHKSRPAPDGGLPVRIVLEIFSGTITGRAKHF